MKKNVGVIGQVRGAISNPAALIVGILLGGFVPLTTYTVAHFEARTWLTWTLVMGGLVYSAKTVFEWAKMAFENPIKAMGFVILLEGVMVTSTVEWVRLASLAYLIAINAIATGCTLARQDFGANQNAKRAGRLGQDIPAKSTVKKSTNERRTKSNEPAKRDETSGLRRIG